MSVLQDVPAMMVLRPGPGPGEHLVVVEAFIPVDMPVKPGPEPIFLP